MNTYNTDSGNGIEYLRLCTHWKKKKNFVIIKSVYRHRKAPQEIFEYINNTIQNMCLKNKCLYMLSDLNDDPLTKGNKLNKIIKNYPSTCQETYSSNFAVMHPLRWTTNTTQWYVRETPNAIADQDLITIIIEISTRAATIKNPSHFCIQQRWSLQCRDELYLRAQYNSSHRYHWHSSP